MSKNLEQYLENVRSILEQKGYEIIDLVAEGSNVVMTTRRFGMTLKMKFSPEELGFV